MNRKTWKVMIQCDVFTLFKKGKNLEIRVASKFFKQFKIGDRIIFNKFLQTIIIDIRTYRDFETMLKAEDFTKIAPGFSQNKIHNKLKQIYKNSQENLGVLVFELKVE